MVVLRKDLRLELRTWETVPAMVLFALVTFVIFHFGLNRPTLDGQLAAGVLVVTLLFAAMLGVNRLFVAEREQGGFDGFLLAPVDRTAMLVAKSTALFLFLVVANTAGLLPGVKAPTAHLETPAALATLVFMSVHLAGVRRRGLRGYLREFAQPTIFLLPLNLLSEVTRTFSLTIRLFGNVMSGEFVIAIVLGLAGLFVPLPLMGLELLTGIIQAYIFTTLAAVFIAAALGTTGKERTS